MTIKATVNTRYDLDLGDGVVLEGAERTNHEELTRWEGTVFRNGQPAKPSRNEGVIWTHRAVGGVGFPILDRRFGDAQIDGLRVVAATDNLPLKAPEVDEEELCDRLRKSFLKLPRERVREVLHALPEEALEKIEPKDVIDETAALREIVDRCMILVDPGAPEMPRSDLPDRLAALLEDKVGTASDGQSAASLERMLSGALRLLDPDEDPTTRTAERRIFQVSGRSAA